MPLFPVICTDQYGHILFEATCEHDKNILTRGSALGPRWGFRPQAPVLAYRARYAWEPHSFSSFWIRQ